MSHQDFVWLFRCQFQTNIWNVTSITCLFHCIWMIKESQILIPAAFCILMATQGAVAQLFSFFFWVQVAVTQLPPAAFFFMWRTLGVMYCRNGRGGGIPQGEQGNSFIWRLLSCLQQIFHKVLRFWHGWKNHFLPVSSSYLKLNTIHQEARSSPLQNGEDSSTVISQCA